MCFAGADKREPLGESIAWEGAEHGPGSQETCADRRRHALEEWVRLHMNLHRSAGSLVAGVLALLACAAPAPAASAPRVETMVVGEIGAALAPAKVVAANATTVRASGRRCAVAAGTPLAALVARGPSLGIRDMGSCSRRRAVDSSGLYVFRVGSERARGQAGWVYKVGRRVGTAGAADPSGPFGTGRRLRGGQRLLWFWCRSAGRCQRTLEVSAPARATAGQPLTVTVRGYDDNGRGVAVSRATVTLGSATATTGAGGRATIVPATAGRARLRATKQGLVESFPRTVTVR
jgi:hypothetical protein